MKKITLLFAVIFSILSSTFAQDMFLAPDYKQIEREVSNSSSPYYYGTLIDKYLKGDSTLTELECRHLYYGYVFQNTYNPTDDSEHNQALATVLSKASLIKEDYNTILTHADALLMEDPFNVRAINAKMLVYAQLNNVEGYKKLSNQRRAIMNAILSSGDGISEKTPFHVIKVAHEYDLLPLFGYKFGGEDKILRGKNVNYITLEQNRFGIDKLYFDITPAINHISRRGGGRL